METINIEKLLEKISDEKPCGDNLEYDPDYQALEQAAAGTPAQEYGDTVIPAEEPDWVRVGDLAAPLLCRTKDLRIAAIYLTRALIHTDGFVGYAQVLLLVRGYLDQYWETVHPQLDPDDDFDPVIRMNAIGALSDQQTTVQALRKLPLIDVPGVGRFSLRDMDIAAGKITTVKSDEGGEGVTREIIEGALKETPLALLQQNVTAIDTSLEAIEQIKTRLVALTDVEKVPPLEAVVTELKHAQTVLGKELLRRGEKGGLVDGNGLVAASGGVAVQHTAMEGGSQVGVANSRADVIIMLDNICDYYAHAEPSSPVPLLLQRARRLVPMSFMEVVKELNADGVAQIEKIVGCEGKKR